MADIVWKESLRGEDKIQEEQYSLPYHWYISPSDYRGRKYFSYLKSCITQTKTNGKKISDSKILDAGCGDGRFIKLLLDAGAQSVDGLDYSEKALSFTRVFLPDVNLYVGDLTKYETLGDKTYDVIYLVETLEHIPKEFVPSVIVNLKKMLNVGGLLIVTVPSILLPLQDKHYQHFSPEIIEEYFKPHFTIQSIIGYANTKKFLFNLCYKIIDNRYWQIKKLTSHFNEKLWPKYCGECDAYAGEGILFVCQK